MPFDDEIPWRCDICDGEGLYASRDADWRVVYVLCRDCHREVRYWAGRDRDSNVGNVGAAVPPYIRDRVIP